jgi:hypothetical protein
VGCLFEDCHDCSDAGAVYVYQSRSFAGVKHPALPVPTMGSDCSPMCGAVKLGSDRCDSAGEETAPFSSPTHVVAFYFGWSSGSIAFTVTAQTF